MPVQNTPREWPVPSAFIAASFAANRAANDEAKSRFRAAVGDLTVREHAVDEAVAPALDRLGDAADFGCVDADTDDVHVAVDPSWIVG